MHGAGRVKPEKKNRTPRSTTNIKYDCTGWYENVNIFKITIPLCLNAFT